MKATSVASPSILSRPIFGGPFGSGRYSLATLPCIARGLHAVRYMVVDDAGAVLSIAEDKREALAGARRLLRDAVQDSEPVWQQSGLWDASELVPVDAAGTPLRSVSRRRRTIFDRSGGRCHYCREPLDLSGKWHVEHMVPKALDGTDQPLNLVAACVACNLAKRDRTAVEFLVDARR